MSHKCFFSTGFFQSICDPNNKSILNIFHILHKIISILKFGFPIFYFQSDSASNQNQFGPIKNNNIKIIAINIAESLFNKISNIKQFLEKENFNILCLLETHNSYKEFNKIKGHLETKKYKVFFTVQS